MKKQQVVIFGGGTAGWMAANAMASKWSKEKIDITLIESSEIGIIGVGEGSTPRLKQFFDTLGIAESEWMPRCNASYKNGISFIDWSHKPGFESYFHPFISYTDRKTQSAFFYNSFARRKGFDVHAHPNRYFLTAYLSEKKLGPIPDYNFPFEVDYGYHFDSHLLGNFLREAAIKRGVRHIDARVTQVKQHENGDIAGLELETSAYVNGDFFVDCSGFRGELIQNTLKVPFISFDNNLFNDAAVVLPTPAQEQLNSQTLSTALKAGWAWNIPLQNRTGNGYVYSSSFCDKDQAEKELRTHLGLLDSEEEARHLRLKVGRVAHHWYRNCVAIGLSQGFIEPLEATALNLVANTIDDFIHSYEAGEFSNKHQAAFNQRVNSGFETIRDYIVAHYILNSRSDTDYWRANGENKNISESLKAILHCWYSGLNLGQEIEKQKIPTSYTAVSWYCLFSGYGIYPEGQQLQAATADVKRFNLADIDDFIKRCSANFKPHNELLEELTAPH